jgi:NADPH-dependent 2,4-dienoyl-CoA reductase/sulfur reductase-like enzyme/rhodanese-related sulfurtransferase
MDDQIVLTGGFCMAQTVLIIGAVALGPKVACRLKRLDPDVEITMIDRDNRISYGGCGIPYFVGGDVAEINGLQSTSAHVVRDARFFKNAKGVQVLTRCEALSIHRAEKNVHVRFIDTGREETLAYDKLVLATGTTPVVPSLPGGQLPGVTPVANLHHAQGIKDQLAKGLVTRAVVIGAGAIGIEMAEALTDLWGVETTLVELQSQVLPVAAGPDMARVLERHMEAKGVTLVLSESVQRIVGDPQTGVTAVETTAGAIPCDLVIQAVGVRPNSGLAQDAGLDVGEMGGILVNDELRTSDPHIYAGGDCIEVRHLLTGDYGHFSLGSLANRQGRVIGTNLAGGRAVFSGVVGNFCLKVFDLGFFRAGLTKKQALTAGLDAVETVVAQGDRAHFYPDQEMMVMKLIADRHRRQVIGVEAVGPNGDAVKARVDAVAALLPYRPPPEAVANLEVSYSPPYASAMDIVNSAANVLENTLDGLHVPADAAEFSAAFIADQTIRVLDVRSPTQAQPFIDTFGDRWQNIPQEELAARVDEVNGKGPLWLICGSGQRSYEAQLVLRRHGINDTINVQGGIKMIMFSDPAFMEMVAE